MERKGEMKYRIKKITDGSGKERYYPQVRIFFIWIHLFDRYWNETVWFGTEEAARKHIIELEGRITVKREFIKVKT